MIYIIYLLVVYTLLVQDTSIHTYLFSSYFIIQPFLSQLPFLTLLNHLVDFI